MGNISLPPSVDCDRELPRVTKVAVV